MQKLTIRKIRSNNKHDKQTTSNFFGKNPRKFRAQLDYEQSCQDDSSNILDLSNDNSVYEFHKNNNYSIKVKHGKKMIFHELFVFLRWYFFFFEVILEEEYIDEDTFLFGDITISISDNIYESSEKEKNDFLKNLIGNFFEGQQLALAELFADFYVKNNMDFLIEYSFFNEVIGIRMECNKEAIKRCCKQLVHIYCNFIEQSNNIIDEKYQTQAFKQMRIKMDIVFSFIIDICACANGWDQFFNFDSCNFDTPFELVLYYIHEFESLENRLYDTKFIQISRKFYQINSSPILKDWMTYYILRGDFRLRSNDITAKRYVNEVSKLKYLPVLLRAKSSNIVCYNSDGTEDYITADTKVPVDEYRSYQLSVIERFLYYKADDMDDMVVNSEIFKNSFNYSKAFDDFSYLIRRKY